MAKASSVGEDNWPNIDQVFRRASMVADGNASYFGVSVMGRFPFHDDAHARTGLDVILYQ